MSEVISTIIYWFGQELLGGLGIQQFEVRSIFYNNKPSPPLYVINSHIKFTFKKNKVSLI